MHKISNSNIYHKVNRDKILYFYENLPTGGAYNQYKTHLTYFSHKRKVVAISEPKYNISNIFSYLFVSIYLSRVIQKRIAESMSDGILVAYGTWLTKSPYLLRYFNGKKLYICAETMREYYDDLHIQRQTIKDKLINIIRIPLKQIDLSNLKDKAISVITNSKFTKKQIDRIYNIESLVIYPRIDLKLFKEYRFTDKKKHQIVSVGSINKYKNQKFILEVINKMPLNVRPSVVLIGNGGDEHYIKEIKHFAKMHKILLTVKLNIDDNTKLRYYHSSKIFVYSPINEPFGLVVEEAMACGLPIFTYPGGGYIEVLSKKNGVIMSDLQIDKWSNAMCKLIRDEKRMREIGKYNYHVAVKKFDAVIMNKQLERLINEL